jgi:hypothetical protein
MLRQLAFASLLFLVLNSQLTAQETKADDKQEEKAALPTIAEHTKDMLAYDGFFPFYWDEAKGQVFLQIDQLGEEFLYSHSLATGLGSNPVGLDRGQLGDQKVVHFERVGPKVLMVQRNLRFRAQTDNSLEKRAVEQSFAQSIFWGGKVVAEDDGKVLVDLTSLLMTDVHGVTTTLSRSEQGDFSLDEKRSAVYLPRCKAFPDNTEFEATLTFSGRKPGNYVRQTTPTPGAISLREHHSFVRLPDDKYVPREYDVRSPSIFITFADYATPLDSPLEKRWITRHRLVKTTADAKLSKPVEPITYYVDAGAPEQIQKALIEGASWWDQAFEAAGFKNAFQVKLLPPDADPLDVRYNVIQWVHRSTRGWSYGGSVIDPRTGEIIKGHVTLGSLRVRQDQLLVNSMHGPTAPGAKCACCGIVGVAEEASLVDLDSKTDALEVALARIRQLSAHEVGHTLGFSHNFAASTYGGRASVMDYPAPLVKITDDGQLDLSDAYAVGIGEWDKLSVQFAYSQFSDAEEEKQELNKLLRSAKENGMRYISDSDSRSPSASHPFSNLWDNGTDPLEQFKHVMRVREIALKNFDPNKVPSGTTTADVAQYFTPIYLHHRYQLNAVGKLIGGHDYEYGYADNGAAENTMVDPAVQKQALDALIQALRPEQLAISDTVRQSISPRPYSTIRDAEILDKQTGRIFDPGAAAKVAIELVLDEIFQPARLSRLTIHSRTEESLSPRQVMKQLSSEVWSWNRFDGLEVAHSRQLERISKLSK